MSNPRWPTVCFGEIMQPNKRPYELGPMEDANLVGMRLYGLGPFHRELKPASKIRKKSHFVIRENDVIYNKLFAWKGTFGIVPAELDGMFVSDKFPTYQLDLDRVDLDFLRWYFRCPPLWEQAREMSTGSAALSKLTLNPPRFLELTITLPPLEEQTKIVARLDHLADLIGEACMLERQSSATTNALLASYLNKLFGNPYRDEVGTLGLKTFESIGNLSSDVSDGPHVTPLYVDEGVPFITVLNITSGHVDFSSHKWITREAYEEYSRRSVAERGDVLLTKDGTIGVPCFVDTDREFGFFVSVALVKPLRDRLDGEFLTWAFRTPYLQERMRNRSRGDMIRHLVLREIRNLQVPCPPLEEQRRIVEMLNGFHAKCRNAEQFLQSRRASIDAMLPSILDRAFKGEM